MTPQQLIDLKALCEKATPIGERCPEKMYLFCPEGDLIMQVRHRPDGNTDTNYEFYYAARTAVPELIERIEYLQERRTHHSAVTLTIHERTEKENTRLREQVETLRDGNEFILVRELRAQLGEAGTIIKMLLMRGPTTEHHNFTTCMDASCAVARAYLEKHGDKPT